MRTYATAFAVLVVLTFATAPVAADTFTFTPTPHDLGDLDHYYYYTWGIDVSALAGMTITEVVLRIEDVTNWDNAGNVLYLHLLDGAPLGALTTWDNQGGGDAFTGQGELIGTFTDVNGSGTTEDLVYTFSDLGLLATFDGYANDGIVAIGIDPDCHYYNAGISLVVTGETSLKTSTASWGEVKQLFR